MSGKLKLNCIQSIWGAGPQQDKSNENRSKCLVVGSMFPHPAYTHSILAN